MKKLYALVFTGFVCSIAHAQVKKGDIVLGGNLGYSNLSQSSDNNGSNLYSNKSDNLTIAPSFGRVIKDNLVLGFDIAYNYTKNSYAGGPNSNGNGFAAGVFLRKYRSLGNNFYLFGQSRLSGSYMHTAQDQQPGTQPTRDVNNIYGFALQFFPGIAYALNAKWQLEAGLPNFFSVSYTNSKETETYTSQPDGHSNSHLFSFQSSITGSTALSVGLRYFIGN